MAREKEDIFIQGQAIHMDKNWITLTETIGDILQDPFGIPCMEGFVRGVFSPISGYANEDKVFVAYGAGQLMAKLLNTNSNFPHHQHCSYETSKRILGK